MKSMKSISLVTLVLCLAFFTVACSSNNGADHSHDATHTEAHHGEGKEYTSAYVCPMHCEGSGSEAEGKCPVCGMAYVAQADHTNDGHSH